MNKSGILKLAILALPFVLCVGVWIVESQTNLFRRIYDDVILDNRNHYLTCKQLPSEDEVLRVMAAHPDTLAKIQQINPGLVGTEMDTISCPDRADILFWYGTHQDRLMIESIINDDTFYGIPYRLENR